MQVKSIKYFFHNYFLDLMFFLLGVGLTIGAIGQPDFGESYKSPGIFPVMVGTIMLIASSIRLISGISNSKKYTSETNSNENKEANSKRTNVVAPMIVILLYTSLLDIMNFYVLTFFFISSLMFILGTKSIFRLLLVSIISNIAIWLIFVQMFKIFLP